MLFYNFVDRKLKNFCKRQKKKFKTFFFIQICLQSSLTHSFVCTIFVHQKPSFAETTKAKFFQCLTTNRGHQIQTM